MIELMLTAGPLHAEPAPNGARLGAGVAAAIKGGPLDARMPDDAVHFQSTVARASLFAEAALRNSDLEREFARAVQAAKG